MNICDLGFFRAIQSLQHQKAPKNVRELIKAVEDAFIEMESAKLNKNFLSLQQVCNEVFKVKGCNKYKLPHMGKDKLQREGRLPMRLEVDFTLVNKAMKLLTIKTTENKD